MRFCVGQNFHRAGEMWTEPAAEQHFARKERNGWRCKRVGLEARRACWDQFGKG